MRKFKDKKRGNDFLVSWEMMHGDVEPNKCEKIGKSFRASKN